MIYRRTAVIVWLTLLTITAVIFRTTLSAGNQGVC